MSHTNYNGISTKNVKDELEVKANEPEETKVDTSPVVNENEIDPEGKALYEPEYILGIVTGCAKLNVRKQPSINADVLLVIGADSDVLVDLDESIGDWYKVYIDEQEGFCMKKFIELDQ